MNKCLLVDIRPYPVKGHKAPSLSLRNMIAYYEKFKSVRKEFLINLHSYELLDKEGDIIKEITKSKPGILGFSVNIWNAEKVFSLCRTVKEKFPETIIVVGGPEVSPIPEVILSSNPSIDLVVTGEGEKVFKDILDSYSNKKIKNIEKISSISFRKGRRIVKTEDGLPVELGTLPSPYLDGCFDFRPKEKLLLTMETSRGCPFSCKFCIWSSKKVRFFPLKRVMGELSFILNRKNIMLYFSDSNFLIDGKRAEAFLGHIIKNNKHNNKIRIEALIDSMSDRLIDLVKDDKNIMIMFGIQSINPSVLKTINRKFDKEKFEKTVSKILENGFQRNYAFEVIFGLPGDDLESYKKTLDYLLSFKLKITSFQLLILPGSEFHKNSEKYGIKFEKSIPHRLVSTKSFSQSDMKKATKISFFVNFITSSPIVQDIFYLISEKVYKDKTENCYIKSITDFMDFIEKEIDLDFLGDYPDTVATPKDSRKILEIKKRMYKYRLKIIKLFILYLMKKMNSFKLSLFLIRSLTKKSTIESAKIILEWLSGPPDDQT